MSSQRKGVDSVEFRYKTQTEDCDWMLVDEERLDFFSLIFMLWLLNQNPEVKPMQKKNNYLSNSDLEAVSVVPVNFFLSLIFMH
jgi:hypothetical protein